MSMMKFNQCKYVCLYICYCLSICCEKKGKERLEEPNAYLQQEF